MGKRRGRIHRLNLQQRMMLWFAGIILALLASVLAFLHLRVTREMRNQVYAELARTQTLFQNVHRIRGDDLLSQCRVLASLTRLRAAAIQGSPAATARVLDDYGTMLGADAVLVADARQKPLAYWWRPGTPSPRPSFLDALDEKLPAAGRTGMDVSTAGIYQTACCPIRDHGRAGQAGTLVIALAIDRRFASRLKSMSGAEITFFAGPSRPGPHGLRSAIVASALPNENQARLQTALAKLHHNPLHVSSEGLDPPYVVDLGEGVQYLSVTAPIRDENRKPIGAYVIQRPLHDELIVVDRMQRTLILVTLVAVLAAVGVSYLLANSVARRIVGVVRAAEALSAGDWRQRVPVEGPSDLRVLAEAFNRMAARLQGWDAELRAEVAARTEELNQALGRLDANLHQMRQFHADASHELRTPLTIMRGEVEVALRSARTPAEYQRVLHSVLEEMNRVSSIVDHLLMLARADSGQIRVEREPVEINEVLEDLHPQALLLAQRKKIAVRLAEQERVVVTGDAGKLRQVFLNLIDNAIKYTPDGGSVELRVASDDGFAVVTVRDTGIGIAPEDIPHIFGRFFRADRARSREMGGTGLGLAICQWVVEAHHGWIDVQSVVGEGSAFTVYIPRTPDTTGNALTGSPRGGSLAEIRDF